MVKCSGIESEKNKKEKRLMLVDHKKFIAKRKRSQARVSISYEK
jgi:hypothetical protein